MWHTERLTIRQLRIDDCADLYQMQGDPEAARFIGGVWSEEKTREVTERIAASYSADPWAWWAVASRDTDQVLGVCWLGPLNPKWCQAMGWDASIEIGYRYARQHWGNGYAAEAAEAMLHRGFEELGLTRIVAVVDVRNSASERVLQKLGMTCMGDGIHESVTIRGYELNRDSKGVRPEKDSPSPVANNGGMENTTLETVEFEGWPDCLRLSNGDAELVVTTRIGPRILRYGLPGGPNAFHVIPATRGQTGGNSWRPYGGHRLWLAPEAQPRSYFPDNDPVGSHAFTGGTLSVANPVEHTTGVAKEMRITLAPTGAAARVVHKLTNHGPWPITLAPWGLSIVAGGGRVVLPQEPFVSHDDDLLPARPLVLWKFTEMGDPRWRWGDKYLSLRQEDGMTTPQKVGTYNAQGWAAHLLPDQAFVVLIDVAPGGPAALTDQGSNFETYTEGPFQEMETLGPLVTLEPGQSAEHSEYWFLAPTGEIADTDAALDAGLTPIVETAKSAVAALRR